MYKHTELSISAPLHTMLFSIESKLVVQIPWDRVSSNQFPGIAGVDKLVQQRLVHNPCPAGSAAAWHGED